MTHASMPTREMVALNADVVGYSRLMADDFESTTAAMEELRLLVTDQVAEADGILVNFVGDNFMAVFGSPESALGAAISITTEIEGRNANVAPARQVMFRMGLDQGSVAVSDDQYFGETLNIAARIQAIAPQGGISVSGLVYKALDEPALRFHPIGQQHLKNIPGNVGVYQFSGLPSDGSVGRVRSSLSLEMPRVAVLPIINQATDEEVKGFSDIIRSDLIHRLARVPQIEVVDTGTADHDHPEIAARYMIETGVHQLRDKARIYATLFDTTTWNVVKSHKWVVDVENLLTISDELADEVARSVEVELVVGEPAGLYAELGDAEAIEKVHLGWYYLRSDNEESWSRAIDLFGEVAASHPDKPYGHVLSAFANWGGASNGWGPNPKETMELAARQAERGIEVGDQTGMAQATKAAVLMSQGREEEALETMEGLEIVRPTCDVTFGLEGSVRRYMGEWEKAVELTDTAMRLTGVNKPWYPTIQACSLFMGGRLEQSADTAQMVLDYQPNNLEALLVLAAAQVEMGMDRTAKATGQTIKDRFPSLDVGAWLDTNPYQDPELVKRWKEDLKLAGAIGS